MMPGLEGEQLDRKLVLSSYLFYQKSQKNVLQPDTQLSG